MPVAEANPPARSSRTLDLAVCATSVAWFLAARELSSRSATGISQRFDLYALQPLLRSMFLVFLLVVGFYLLQTINQRHEPKTRDLMGLPQRPSASREWGLGAAIGWGSLLLSVLPIAIAGGMHAQIWAEVHSLVLLFGTLAGLAFATLAQEIVFRGYGFRHLIRAVGPVGATIFLSLLYAVISALNPAATGMGVLTVFLLGLLLSVGWLRTHGLWLSWGLNFGWTASMGILFGLPTAGSTDLSSVVQTRTSGARWLTGGDFGPHGALFTAVALLVGMAFLVRLTRDYAWEYTKPVLVPGGYPMDVAPPPAHTAMEQTGAPPPPPPLVQILPSTPQQRSAADPPR